MRRSVHFAGAMAAIALGCGRSTAPDDNVVAFRLFAERDSAKVLQLAVGDREQLAFEARNAAGALVTYVQPSYRSANPAVASVDVNGLVTGRGVGGVQVFASLPQYGATFVDSVLVVMNTALSSPLMQLAPRNRHRR
jgi:hypothetical protein